MRKHGHQGGRHGRGKEQKNKIIAGLSNNKARRHYSASARVRNHFYMSGVRAQLLLTATAGVYFGLNTVLNVTNRWLLGVKGFSFPATLTVMHMLFSAAVLTAFIRFRGGRAPPPPKSWLGLAAVGCAQGGNVGLNNLSLVFLPRSVAQLIR
jgi:hypothetical protein